MKIAILGPVTTKTYFGGVAVFDEELAAGFKHNKWEVVLITNQKNADSEKNGVPIRIINAISASKILKEESPDIILASLQYAKYWSLCRSNAIKIYFLHGFFNRSYYGKVKSELASPYQRLITKQSQYVFANSYFTKMVNDQFFGIHTNRVFHLGVTTEYYNAILNTKIPKEKGTILYVGRLVSAKGIGNLLRAMKVLKDRGMPYKVYIAGGGPDKEKLEMYVAKNNLNVQFLGRVSQKDLVAYYSRAEIFVSLNPSEPFGIVFPEALLARCKIVCPCTGGQVEYLMDYKDTVAFVDEASPDAVANGIERLGKSPVAAELSNKYIQTFRYDTIAKEMIDYLNERGKTNGS